MSTKRSLEILGINETGKPLPDLIPLCRIPVNYSPGCMSRPFIGYQETYLICKYKNTLVRLKLSNDSTTRPIVEEMGPVEADYPSVYDPETCIKYGPLASVFQKGNWLEIATYDLYSRHDHIFRRHRYRAIEGPFDSQKPTIIAGLDDNKGRIVLRLGGRSEFLVMDLV